MNEALAAGPCDLFHRAAWAAFETACAASAPLTHSFEVGGRTLEACFAGEAMLAQVLPALAHLQTAPAPAADLRVAVWDSASTGQPLPTPPWRPDDQVSRGEIRGFDTGPDLRLALQGGSGALSMLHPGSRRGMLWLDDAARCPSWEAAAPLRGLLHWWCAPPRRQLVHGAAVGRDERAVLLTGKGGSGKSTTALTALLAGFDYLGDDYLLCDLATQGPLVHSLYNSAKVDAQTLRKLPGLPAAQPEPGEEKAVLYTREHFPAQLRRRAQLCAILVPRVTGGNQTSLHALSAAQAFLALAPTTLFQLPGAGRDAAGFLRRLVAALPCYELQLGASPDSTLDAIENVLESA